MKVHTQIGAIVARRVSTSRKPVAPSWLTLTTRIRRGARSRWMPRAIVALALMAGWPAVADAGSEQTIDMAFVGPMTGPVTQYGDMMQEGIAMAVERINQRGGVLGRSLRVVAFDDACEAKQAPAAANRVLNAGISFVIGPACSGATAAGAAIYENEGVLMMTPAATSRTLLPLPANQFLFRTIGRDDQQGEAAAAFIAKRLHAKRIAVLHDRQAYGYGLARSVRDALQKQGIQPVMFESIAAGEADYSAVISQLRAAQIDLVYYGGYHPEMGLLLRQAREQNLTARFMGSEGAANTMINAIAGDAVTGMLVTMPADFSHRKENIELVQAFTDAKREAQGAFQLTSYSAVLALTQAIQATGSTEPETVARYLRSHTIDSPIGPLAWDERGDLKSFDFAVYEWQADGGRHLYGASS